MKVLVGILLCILLVLFIALVGTVLYAMIRDVKEEHKK